MNDIPAIIKRAEPVYLGDGLYAAFTNYDVELYASNGVNVTNRVWLEPEALALLVEAAKEHWGK